MDWEIYVPFGPTRSPRLAGGVGVWESTDSDGKKRQGASSHNESYPVKHEQAHECPASSVRENGIPG